MGTRCSDVGLSRSPNQDYSFSGPPLLNQHIVSGINLTLKKSNVIASLAQFVFQLESQRTTHCLSTFNFSSIYYNSIQFLHRCGGQTGNKLRRYPFLDDKTNSYKNHIYRSRGRNKVPEFSNQHVSLGPIALPIGMFSRHRTPMDPPDGSFGSTCLVLESELDSSIRIGGWVEMKI